MLQRVFCFDRAIREHPTTLEALSVVPANINSTIEGITSFSPEPSPKFSGILISFIIDQILSIMCKLYCIIFTVVTPRNYSFSVSRYYHFCLNCCLEVLLSPPGRLSTHQEHMYINQVNRQFLLGGIKGILFQITSLCCVSPIPLYTVLMDLSIIHLKEEGIGQTRQAVLFSFIKCTVKDFSS